MIEAVDSDEIAADPIPDAETAAGFLAAGQGGADDRPWTSPPTDFHIGAPTDVASLALLTPAARRFAGYFPGVAPLVWPRTLPSARPTGLAGERPCSIRAR